MRLYSDAIINNKFEVQGEGYENTLYFSQS